MPKKNIISLPTKSNVNTPDSCLSHTEEIMLLKKHTLSILNLWKKTPEFNLLSSPMLGNVSRWFYILGKKVLEQIVKPNDSANLFSREICILAKEKGIGIRELTKAILLLHRFTDTFLRTKYHCNFDEIHNCFDRILPLFTQSFEDITCKIYNDQLSAIDTSTILSKFDPQGRIIYANKEYLKLSQYSTNELIGKHFSFTIHPDAPKKVIKQISTHILAKKMWRGVIKNTKKDRSSWWVQSTIIPILDEQGVLFEFLNIQVDITKLKEALKNIEEYKNALDESCLIIGLDLDGKIQRANHEFCIMTGYSQKKLQNRYFLPWFTGQYIPVEWSEKTIVIDETRIIRHIQKALREKKTWKGLLKIQTLHRGVIWCSSTIIPILDTNERIAEYVVVQTDVTDIEIAQMHLRNSYKKLQELNQKKDEFLNIASHELRTPMTSIRWYVSMILDGDGGEVAPVARQYLENVFQNSTRLLMLINEMLDISKIESGKQYLNIVHHDIGIALKHITDELKIIFTHKKQHFILDIPKKPTLLSIDSDKFKQIVVNILGNANKFTPEWWTIYVKLRQDKHQTIVAIRDTGIGIEKEHFEMIFEKFSQVKNPLVRDINGTGLGLPIVKSLMDIMGGTVSIKSQPGKWSTFYLTFPTKKPRKKIKKKSRKKVHS